MAMRLKRGEGAQSTAAVVQVDRAQMVRAKQENSQQVNEGDPAISAIKGDAGSNLSHVVAFVFVITFRDHVERAMQRPG